jgi:hypothetical protein
MRIPSAIKWAVRAKMCTTVILLMTVSAGPQSGAQAQAGTPASAQGNVKEFQKDVKEFQQKVQAYLSIQKKALGQVPSIPKETKDTALIVKHQEQVAAAIRALRPNAMPGEIFAPWLRDTISGAIKQEVSGKAGADAKATIVGEGNPKSQKSPVDVKLTINGGYPEKAPLSSVPPSVLMALPALPEGVDYRFVGHTLILRDAKANIIVDILPNAF